MTIKDIARMAGVSVSTVSKVLNNKADSLAEDTRRKVLDVVREHHYTPYAGVKNMPGARRYLLAVAGLAGAISPALLQALEAAALKRGYGLLVSFSSRDVNELLCALELLGRSVDGILLVPPEGDAQTVEWLRAQNLPAALLEGEAVPGFGAFGNDWAAAATDALGHLERLGHRQIGLLAKDLHTPKTGRMLQSLKALYLSREQKYDKKLAATLEDAAALLQTGVTAVVVAGLRTAAAFYRLARQQDLRIPEELSLLVLDDTDDTPLLPRPDMIKTDIEMLANGCMEYLTGLCEEGGSKTAAGLRLYPPVPVEGETLAPPQGIFAAAPPILVVGSLNLDVVMKVKGFPLSGETTLIHSMSSHPGGKGANQAVGVARLGGQAALLGRIGNDEAGKVLYTALRAAGVDTKAVSTDRQTETGKAYINVTSGGDSFIEVYGGANQRLEKRHIHRNAELFRTARYCLVMTELPLRVVQWAVQCAQAAKTDVILKPCSVSALPGEILQNTFMAVPNQKEAGRLAGEGLSLQEQAEWFLQNGCQHVIITLAEQGCFYLGKANANGAYYPAYCPPGRPVIDTSGASDAFISALAAYMAEGNPIAAAIRFAGVAAGLSVTREGALPSLPERAALALLGEGDE